jgi:predicted Zn-dependent protease
MAIARFVAALLLAASMQASLPERAAYFDAALAPRPGVTVDVPAELRAKNPKDVAEAAAAFERGLVFVNQGAWKEAEKELHNAEKKTDNKAQEYVFAAAYSYLKLHRADDALKRYEKIYKAEPSNGRAILGMAAAYEDMQHYADAVRIWQRYTRTTLPPREKAAAEKMLAGARELFAKYYEIAENPAGGAKNLATPEQELSWGLGYAQQLSASGVPTLQDEVINSYVKTMCADLVAHAKQFPTNYEVFVLDSATVNAMTTPGYIFVYRGILNAVKTEDELAGVLAHEIGHSVAHHVGKAQTKAALDQQQVEKLKASNSKFSQFLGKMMESGNPLGQLSFSRENEAQADRLGVHIAYDSGYNPDGLVGMFRTFESMSPSSRSAWDLMTRTHPFSIDRVNAVTEYSALLPSLPRQAESKGFAKMKARLATLPPPNDAVGLQKSTGVLPRPGSPQGTPQQTPPGSPQGSPAPSGATRDFSITGTPVTGEIPADWGARKTESGTVVFEGTKGTEAYEMSVELEVLPKATIGGRTLSDVARAVQGSLLQRPKAQVDPPEATPTTRALGAMIVNAAYSMQAQGRVIPFHHISAIVEYADHIIILSYYGPDAYYDKYAMVFQSIAQSIRYNGR